jgi:CubicO group peptidase (beta-lactamase class C family)
MRTTICARLKASAAALCTALAISAPTHVHAEQWPTDSWPVATPAALGVDAQALAAVDADIRSGHYPLVDSLFVARCGQQVFSATYAHDYGKTFFKEAHERGPLNARLTGPYNYFDPAWHPYYHGTAAHSMQSISKTVTSIVIGIAIGRGDFRAALSTPVLHYFDPAKVKNLDDRKQRMTIDTLLTMTAGLEWNEDLPYDDPANASSLMEASDDWARFVIDRPMAAEPGKTFAYSSGIPMLLAHIFKQETGQDLASYAREHLFEPLGIRVWHWKQSPAGEVDAEGGLYLTTADLAKIGYLYLKHGTWDGHEIVPASWVDQSLQPRVVTDEFSYGFQWWLLPHGTPKTLAWAGRGIGGQTLLVYPENDLIIVSTAWHILSETWLERDLTQRLQATVATHSCASPAPTPR